ncbi:MAG TPA: hypothetical protein VEL76_39485 [Gemmataceae bacterium]|nr:hypothetical protein [Gemmataceae bacterium]
MPTDAPSTNRYPSPLDVCLSSAVQRTEDAAVRRWLLALLNTDQHAEAPAAHLQPSPLDALLASARSRARLRQQAVTASTEGRRDE